jgi:hypothetical protein
LPDNAAHRRHRTTQLVGIAEHCSSSASPDIASAAKMDLDLNFSPLQGEDDGVPEDVQEHGQDDNVGDQVVGKFDDSYFSIGALSKSLLVA